MTANTYVPLRQETVATTAASVTFSLTGITGYTDLVLVMNMQGVAGSSSGANTAYITFNGDTTSGFYSRTLLSGQSTVVSSRDSTQNRISLGNQYESSTLATIFGQMILNIQNYANTNVYKNVLSHYGSNADRVGLNVGVWRNTNAITSMTITNDSTNGIAVGSSFSLYGIKNWTNIEASPKATGGYVSSDSTYWYHAFPFSTTFTPSQSLTADVLVVSGGGSAGYASYGSGGGGGAGGISYNASQSFASATTYTMTVGAGGATATGMGNQGSTSSCIGGALSFSVVGGGGGGGGSASATGTAGGNGACGGGSQGNNTTGGTGSIGYNGGSASSDSNRFASGGGGGMGAVGGNGSGGGAPAQAGAGGNGISTYSSWHLATGYGQNVSGSYYIAGGGGGGGDVSGTGGYGGGGSAGSSGLSGTGGGGGAKSGGAGGQGGSGIVVIRYAK